MDQAANFYLRQPEPARSCMLALKEIILAQDPGISPAWKYGMPFFCYNGKMFVYLWTDKKTGQPYLGIVEGRQIEHPLLVAGTRARMKILELDAGKDLPIDTIHDILQAALDLYRNGVKQQ
jgi:hypothetical protein